MVHWLRNNAAVVWLAALALAILGGRAIFTLPSGIYPEMVFPRVVVVAHAGQLAPDLIEAQITRPLEEALAVVPGVRHVRARTIRGAVELSLQLTDDTDPLQAQNACQAAIEHVPLPRNTTLKVERVLPTSVPVITFNLESATKEPVDGRVLRNLAERVVRPAFARVSGVGGVELQGGAAREIAIEIDPLQLASIHLTPSQLGTKLEALDQVITAGRVFDEHQTLPVVLDAQAADLEQLRALPVAVGPAGTVTLGAVATVKESHADPDVIVRGPHGEAVAISVARLPGASTPEVVHGIADAVAAIDRAHALPATVRLAAVYDQAELVDESLSGVRDAILIGIGLSLLVIALSLRDLRAGAIAALPVPITLLGTFAIMSWLGLTLNLMSLGGLAVAIGLVVDDAIVVTEGVVARLEEGLPIDEAVSLGVADMLAAVIGTTITTVVVFAPLALLTGVTGRFLGAFALTLAIAVLLSMVMALTTIPILARYLRRRPRKDRDADRIGNWIRRLIGFRLAPLLVIAALAAGGVLAYRRLSTGFLPAMDEGAFVIDFFLPAGTSLEETDRIAIGIDAVLSTSPDVVTFTRRTGTELGPATATMQSRGDIMVKLVPRSSRDDITEVIDHVRDQLHGAVPEARIEYVQVLADVLADLAGNPEPIEIKVFGDDPRALEEWAEAAGEALGKRPEVVDVFDGREGATPILRGRLDLPRIARLGLDASMIGADLEIAVAGKEVAQILRPERVIPVRLRYPDAVRFSADALAHSPIAYGPHALSLEQVIDFDRPLAPAVLRRDGLRSVLVMTAATPDGNLGAAEDAVRATLRDHPLPRGAQFEIGGQAASGAQSRRELLAVAGVSTLLVLLILILQLHSLRFALVVLVSAPLSTVGGLLALAITGTPLDVSSITGLILLVGLVVKNGILLLEHAQRSLADGVALPEAIAAAARRRLRPILMTTAATLAGLAPLAFGFGAGSDLQRPLAIAVIGGLVLSMLVTLVVTPGLTALVGGRSVPSAAASDPQAE